MNPPSHKQAPDGRGGDLRYGDVAKIAQEGAQRGLSFAGAHTIQPRSRYWVLRLRAADGTLHRVESWARWWALRDASKNSQTPPPSAD